ncbi:MAG: antitoxin family protein [Candidatus Hydrogenedentes bacterium]|nr:antitoxin family protein [Candidatus Hydrogenedentota bacterium]
MTKTLTATYDGEVLRPDEPLELPPNTRVQISIDIGERQRNESVSFLEVARNLRLEGPADWSTRIHEYLYGFPPDQDE